MVACLSPCGLAVENMTIKNDEKQVSEKQSDGLKPFGHHLFQGAFAKESFKGFNPDYQIDIGDAISVQLWGAYEYRESLTVDPQGNIFLPKIGPVYLLGVKNSDLNRVVKKKVEKIFLKNVDVYTSLETNQPVKVYVTGFVKNPGLYPGVNTDSILHYLDLASGVDEERGSYISIKILRHGKTKAQVNLYEFISKGKMPILQFQDGDTILVEAQKPSVHVRGLVQNANVFELDAKSVSLSELMEMAHPLSQATHVRMTRNKGAEKTYSYHTLKQSAGLQIQAGDELIIVNDKQNGNLSIRVEGEHRSQREFIVKPGTTIAEVISQLNFSELSDREHVQLYRKRVRETQSKRLKESLDKLERSILGASSISREEAEIRAKEADMLLKLVERAKQVEPKGQVVLNQKVDLSKIVLEEDDLIVIPQQTNVVMIHGEVQFPNAVIHHGDLDLDEYIKQAGGFTDRADEDRVLVLHQDGSFSIQESGFFASDVAVRAGDEIFVIPEIDTKTFQLTKDISQILFNMAATAKVILTI